MAAAERGWLCGQVAGSIKTQTQSQQSSQLNRYTLVGDIQI